MPATLNGALVRHIGWCLIVAITGLTAMDEATAQLSGPWWWLTIDGTEHHTPDNYAAWHGRLMVIAWSVFAPVGVIVARFYKVTPKQPYPKQLDNQFWWISHQGLQYGCVLFTLIAVFLVFDRSPTQTPSTSFDLHAMTGWTLCLLCVLQVIGAWLRGSKGGPVDVNAWPDSPVTDGDHYNLTRRRLIFEQFHIAVGYSTLLLAFLTTFLGLERAGAPRWMWATLFAWWFVVVIGYIQLQRKNTHVRTYQAIWGPSQEHPGNRTNSREMIQTAAKTNTTHTTPFKPNEIDHGRTTGN